jgi:plasmid stabilization system protein ParE
MGARKIRFTQSFDVTFDAALAFLVEQDAAAAALRLQDAVLRHLPDLLRRHPLMGRDFMRRSPESVEAGAAYERVAALLGDKLQLREYILADHLVLYAVAADAIYLIGIRHHRQNAYLLRPQGD